MGETKSQVSPIPILERRNTKHENKEQAIKNTKFDANYNDAVTNQRLRR